MIDLRGLRLSLERLENEDGFIPDDAGNGTIDDQHYTLVMVSNKKPVLAAQPTDDEAIQTKADRWLSAGTVDGVVFGTYVEDESILKVDQIKEA